VVIATLLSMDNSRLPNVKILMHVTFIESRRAGASIRLAVSVSGGGYGASLRSFRRFEEM